MRIEVAEQSIRARLREMNINVKILASVPLRMGMKKECQVLTNDEDVIELFMNDFEITNGLPCFRIPYFEGNPLQLRLVGDGCLNVKSERVWGDFFEPTDQAHATARTKSGGGSADVAIHGAVILFFGRIGNGEANRVCLLPRCQNAGIKGRRIINGQQHCPDDDYNAKHLDQVRVNKNGDSEQFRKLKVSVLT